MFLFWWEAGVRVRVRASFGEESDLRAVKRSKAGFFLSAFLSIIFLPAFFRRGIGGLLQCAVLNLLKLDSYS